MENKEFYVILNKENLMFCKDYDDYTTDVDKAMNFDNVFDCRDELFSFCKITNNEDVVNNFAIYKVKRITETRFERMEI